MNTGLVSPQYHVTHDDFFETVQDTTTKETAIWKKLAGFVKKPKIPPPTHLSIQKRKTKEITVSEGDTNMSTQSSLHEDSNTDKHNPQDFSSILKSKSGRLIHNKARLLVTKSSQMNYGYYFSALHQEDYKIQDEMCDPIAFISKCNKGKDTMYYHQAIVAHDKENFIDVIIKEFNDHTERKQRSIVDQKTIP